MGNAAPVKEPVSEPQPNLTFQIVEGEDLSQSHAPPVPEDERRTKHKSCWFACIKISYVLISVINIFLSIALMAVAVSAAIAIKAFSTEQSGRVISLILLAVVAAVALSITIYAMVAVAGNHYKHVRGTSIVLFLLAITISVVIGVSMKIGEEDEIRLSHSLSESFELSQDNNLRHVKLWTAIQNDLTCCGVSSPEEYRHFNLPAVFPPDVPISCCPSFDPNRSNFVQEREKEACKARREYYNIGCRKPVIELFIRTTRRVMMISIVVIIVMVWLSIKGAIWTHYCKKREKELKRTPSMNLTIKRLFTKQQTITKP